MYLYMLRIIFNNLNNAILSQGIKVTSLTSTISRGRIILNGRFQVAKIELFLFIKTNDRFRFFAKFGSIFE